MSEFGLQEGVDLDRIIDDLMETYRICHEAAAYCIDSGGELATLERLRAFDDCAEANLTLANFLLRVSEHAGDAARLCYKISSACARGIEGIEHGDDQLRAAYAACQQSRHACLEFLGENVEPSEDAHDATIQESFPASDPPPPPSQI